MQSEKQRLVLQGLQGKKAAVVGIGLRSGVPLIRFLHEHGCQVVACDRKPAERLSDVMSALAGLPVEYRLGENYLDDLADCHLLFRTPGMRPDLTELKRAEAAGAKITSEIELVFKLASAPIIGITGSDGKTTTTTLIYEMLKADGRDAYLGGNIGHSLIEEVLSISPKAEIVLELSSFQLMCMRQSPETSLITNLSPNHLDYHLSMDEYVQAKANILLHQHEDNVAVLNFDNPATNRLSSLAKGTVHFFSLKQKVSSGAYLEGEKIMLDMMGEVAEICRTDEIKLLGWHNVENLLAAATVARSKGVSIEAISQVARHFGGVPHRLEFVRQLEDVRYYNDSIASSPTRTIAGLQAIPYPTVLIAGGYDKKIPFEPLAEAIVGKVSAVALIGETAKAIESAIRQIEKNKPGEKTILAQFETLDEALNWSRQQARPGSAVVLSPACASFDMFKDFEERGQVFKRLVRELG